MPFFPNFLLRDVVGWLTALGVLAALAAYFPAELGVKADPFVPAPIGIKPEWYFMFTFQTLKYVPAHVLCIEGEVVGILGFSLAGILFLMIPFLDRQTARGRPSKLFTWIGIGIIVYILVLTYWDTRRIPRCSGYLTTRTRAVFDPPEEILRQFHEYL